MAKYRARRPSRGFRRLLQLGVFLALAAPLPILPAAAGGAPPPFGIGDWTVTGTELFIDRGLVLDGNLTVAAGGSLTLVNSSLLFLPGPHELRVLSGGSLRMLSGSSASSFDATEKDLHRAGFWVERGARAEFRNASFDSIGIIYRWQGSTKLGGVCVYADGAVVDNCTFSGNYIGLTLFDRAAVTNCRFSENGWAGAVSYGADTEWTGCTFVRNFYGAVAYRGNPAFERCSFTDNAIGAAADSTAVRFSRCDFTDNVRKGLYVSLEQGSSPVPSASQVRAEYCLFENNSYGIDGVFFYSDEGGNIWPLEHELLLVDPAFIKNREAGIKWDRLIPDGEKRRSSSTWTVRGRSEVLANRALFKGNLIVEGELDVSGSQLLVDCEDDGWQQLEVRPGGRLNVSDNSTLAAASGHAFALRCRPGSSFAMDRSVLRGCGWDASEPYRAGPLLETGDVRLSRTTVAWCPAALVLDGARGVLVEDCALGGNITGLLMDGSSVLLRNCTVGARGPSRCRLDGGSFLDSVNSTVDRFGIELLDERSRANISWYLDVLAVWSDGRPAAGATLVVTDVDGVEVAVAAADAGGSVDDLVVLDTSVTPSGYEVRTPHHLNCTLGPVCNETDVAVTSSLRVELVLRDTEPPSISVTSPRPDEHLGSRRVRLAGLAEDNLALATVALVLDGHRRHLVHQQASGGPARIDWDLVVELAEGPHTLEALAVDAGGTSARSSFGFTVDATPPRVSITSPRDRHLTNAAELDVEGRTEPGTAVEVNGVQARVAGGSFTARVRLSEGENLVTARATDRAGNRDEDSVSVRLDSVPPALWVSFSPDAAAVRDPQVALSGVMEFGAALSVNGRPVVLPGLADNFTTLVFLSSGNNTIRVEATDAAGNVNTVERSMVLDTAAPVFEVLYPPDGLLTNEPSLAILLLAESGTAVSAGNVSATVPGGPGGMANLSLRCGLVEGTNDIAIKAVDAAGNVFQRARRVVLDTTAPVLELSSPAPGSTTSATMVYLVGRTDPDATLTVNGVELEVGFGGSFSGELELGAGKNPIVVRAQDPLGNLRELELNVTRVPARGDTTVVGGPPPDWPFFGFVAAAMGAAAGEGWWLWRRLSRRPPHPAPGTRHPEQTMKREVG
ncbi:MAG: right-handed parallel beta-helix repeat-containing protein [Euryarchaeota archaeon]|nr:right-handed parallel beta-helix repeat-containing protein [Euryarchaeota archaeon]